MSENEICGELSDEEDIIYPHSMNSGLQGYSFQPQRDPTENQRDETNDSDTPELRGPIRPNRSRRLGSGADAWCQCNSHCSEETLKKDKECVCCKEVQLVAELATTCDDNMTTCVTNNEDFQILCLRPVVLKNTLTCLNQTRQDHWNVVTPSNRSYRWAAYRQFTWWVYGKLQRFDRRIIPACVVHCVRKYFPAIDEEYEGYHSSPDSSDSSSE